MKTDRDNTTRTGARTPGVERQAARMAVLERTASPTQRGERNAEGGGNEGRMQTVRARHVGVAGGKAPFDKLALKPYWGKPAVRNFRGDDGNVGIIRSPVRAIVLPDTGKTGKATEGETVAARPVVAERRSKVRGAKGPCCTCSLDQEGRQGCCVKKTRKRRAVRKMKEGPSEPACRGGFKPP